MPIISLFFELDTEMNELTLQQDAGYEGEDGVGGHYELTPGRLKELRDALDRLAMQLEATENPTTYTALSGFSTIPGNGGGWAIKTASSLGATTGMLIAPARLDARRPDAEGTLLNWVGGHGGDVWWVRHSDDSVAAYTTHEIMVHLDTKGNPITRSLNGSAHPSY